MSTSLAALPDRPDHRIPLPARVRVLHVTEALGGGTATALIEFVRSSPEVEHHLIAIRRAGSEIEVDLAEHFASVQFAVGLGSLGRLVRRSSAALSPDAVHLHSSWAGLVGRLALPRRSVRVLYSPHCFYFERSDVRPVARRLARLAERLLAHRADLIIAVSPHEAALARALGAQACVVPNTARNVGVDLPPASTGQPVAVRPRAVLLGRVSAQKDPRFLLAVLDVLRRRAVELDWMWIGGGDDLLCAELREAGVAVTGWLPASDIVALLRQAKIYVHTAAWESCPMSILEAAAVGLPVVVRSLPPLVSLGLDPGLLTPEHVADEIRTLLATGTPRNPQYQLDYALRHGCAQQVAALEAVYVAAPPVTAPRSLLPRRSVSPAR